MQLLYLQHPPVPQHDHLQRDTFTVPAAHNLANSYQIAQIYSTVTVEHICLKHIVKIPWSSCPLACIPKDHQKQNYVCHTDTTSVVLQRRIRFLFSAVRQQHLPIEEQLQFKWSRLRHGLRQSGFLLSMCLKMPLLIACTVHVLNRLLTVYYHRTEHVMNQLSLFATDCQTNWRLRPFPYILHPHLSQAN